MVIKMNARVRILPTFIILASAIFLFKTTGLVSGFDSLVQEAEAQENVQDQQNTGQQQTQTSSSEVDLSENTDPLKLSRSELDLLQDLAVRRNELDERSRQIDMRERLLEATENRIDDKIIQLKDLETRIQAVVATYEQNENEQMDSLVKVYETMKPKDAAKIFETLDNNIQLDVAIRMKEARMAPILAAMSADKAKDLTHMLATRAKLPTIEG